MTSARPNPLHLVAAFASGGLLTLMIHFNAELARYGNALFSSWTAHGSGMVFAVMLVGALALVAGRGTASTTAAGTKAPAPLWAYLGGVSGAITVMMSSVAANSPIALSGTLALGLAGQVLFSLAADRFGLFGLPVRRIGLNDLAALALIVSGSVLIILFAYA